MKKINTWSCTQISLHGLKLMNADSLFSQALFFFFSPQAVAAFMSVLSTLFLIHSVCSYLFMVPSDSGARLSETKHCEIWETF